MSKNSSLSYKNQNMCSIQINPKIRSNGSLNKREIPKKQCNTKLPSDDFISYVLRNFQRRQVYYQFIIEKVDYIWFKKKI